MGGGPDRPASANYPNLRGRIRAVGFGESRPIAPNTIDGRDNPAGRAVNRRVEIEFGAVETPDQ